MVSACFAIPCPGGEALAIMPCPTLEVLDQLCAQGITTVLSMLPPDEAEALGMAQEGAYCAERGMVFLSHPVVDFGLPDRAAFVGLIDQLVVMIRAGEHLAVHCRAGIGRSGMVTACMLIALGLRPQDAQAVVSAARGVAVPDTPEQGAFIASFAQQWSM